MVEEVISVKYKEHDVGAISFNTETGLGAFEYEPAFIKTGIELSPIKMPYLEKFIHSQTLIPLLLEGYLV